MKHLMAKGSLYVLISQALFLISSFLLHFGLGRYLGPEKYGIVGVILSLLAIFQLFLLHGLHESVSKFISERKEQAHPIYKKSQWIQFIFALSLALLYYLTAPLIANFLNDMSLLPYLRISALIIPAISLYSICMAYLEGLRRFKSAAVLKITYGWSKIIFIVGFLFFGYKIGKLDPKLTSIVFSFFLAAILSFLVFHFIIKKKKNNEPFNKWEKLLKLAIPIIIFYIGIVFIINIDLILVKSFIKIPKDIGLYTSAVTICRLPYTFFLALTTSLLPFIAKAKSENNFKVAKNYITKTLRYLIILLLPLIVLISTLSNKIASLAYGQAYIGAGVPLSILIWGYFFIILFSILSTSLMAINKIKHLTITIIGLIPLTIILNFLLIPLFQLKGAAIALTITSLIGFIITIFLNYKEFGSLLRLKSIIKMIIASIITYLFLIKFSFSGIAVLISLALGYGLFMFILLILKEFKKEDFEIIKNLILRKKMP